MICRPNLRVRLWLGAAALAVLAVTAAGIAAYGLSRTQTHAAEAMAAQRRIEAYGGFSARVNDWVLGWLTQGGAAPDASGVLTSLDALDRLVAEDVAAAASADEATRRARQSVSPARLRALFGQLQGAFLETPPGSPGGEAAIAFYATQAPAVSAAQIEQETRRRDAALAAMQGLQRSLILAALGVGAAAPLVLAALYLLILRPLFARLGRAAAEAESMAMGSMPAGEGKHDELGLMFARLRQMAMRIDRRRTRLTQDYGRLEAIVVDRTAALSKANDRLALIDANRRQFFADVGHELRTPLTVIMGEAELGARLSDPETRAAFETIRARSLRLFRRIEDILRIARSESGQLELTRGPVALDETITLAQADLALMLRRADVAVTAPLSGLVVAGDADWLRQVFAGLFENAAKYAGRGACVTVTAHADGGLARIEVKDTGPGLPAGLEQTVFERFSRDGGNAAPGFGVGLALARWVVEASNGTLEVRPGAGGLWLHLALPLWEEG